MEPEHLMHSEERVALPPEFKALIPFAEIWGRFHTPAERYLYRQSSSMDALRGFHAAVAPRLEEIFRYLDGFPTDELPEPAATLYRTALGLTEAAMAVETFGQPNVPNAPFPHHVEVEAIEYEVSRTGV
jgi:hypothetical protein